MAVGEKIKLARKKNGLTQKALGQKCGMPDSQIRQYESERFKPKLDTLRRIANALDVPLYELMENEYTVEDIKEDLRNLPPDEAVDWKILFEDKLKQIDCSVSYSSDKTMAYLYLSDGILEMPINELKQIDDSVITYLHFKLEELKMNRSSDLRPYD